MEIEVGKTAKYLRETQGVPERVKEQLKEYNRWKKLIVDALKEEELTVPQLAEKLQQPKSDVMYYLMSLIKYGIVKTGEIDDMDEYFSYKLAQ